MLPQASKCDVECMTIARACAQVSDELDLSDLSEALFKGKKRSALSSEACHETTDVCTKKPPPVPKVGALQPLLLQRWVHRWLMRRPNIGMGCALRMCSHTGQCASIKATGHLEHA
jgi:hypothetical protein